MLRKPDERRKLTQTWRFTDDGRLMCAHRGLFVQAKDGFVGLIKGLFFHLQNYRTKTGPNAFLKILIWEWKKCLIEVMFVICFVLSWIKHFKFQAQNLAIVTASGKCVRDSFILLGLGATHKWRHDIRKGVNKVVTIERKPYCFKVWQMCDVIYWRFLCRSVTIQYFQYTLLVRRTLIGVRHIYFSLNSHY